MEVILRAHKHFLKNNRSYKTAAKLGGQSVRAGTLAKASAQLGRTTKKPKTSPFLIPARGELARGSWRSRSVEHLRIFARLPGGLQNCLQSIGTGASC